MKKGLLAVAALAALALSASPAPAFFFSQPSTLALILDWPGYSVYPPGTVFQPQVVTAYQQQWYSQQVPTVVPRVTYKIETTPVKTYVYVTRVVEEKEAYVTYAPVARLVEKQETTTVMVPMILTDPAGMPMVITQPVTKTHTIKHPVYEMQPTVKYRMVRSTKLVPEERITDYQQVVPTVSYDQVPTMQWQSVNVPYQRIVTVPTYDPHHSVQLFWP